MMLEPRYPELYQQRAVSFSAREKREADWKMHSSPSSERGTCKLTSTHQSRPFAGFVAILYYEFLWNLRKKKTIGLFILIFALATLFVFLPPALAYYRGSTLQPQPDFAYSNASQLTGILLFLVAVATTMNSISGEF